MPIIFSRPRLTALCSLFFLVSNLLAQSTSDVVLPPMAVGGQESGTVTITWSEDYPLPPEVSFTLISANPAALDSLNCCLFEYTFDSHDMVLDGDGWAIGGYTNFHWSLLGQQFPSESFSVEYNRGGNPMGTIQFSMEPFITPELPAIHIATEEESLQLLPLLAQPRRECRGE